MTTETTDQAATVAAPEPTDPLARESLELLAALREATRARADLDRRFRHYLSPEAIPLERELSDAVVDEHGAANDLHVAELCRHLPGFAPTIRLLWAHVIDERPDRVGRCCTDGESVEV